ncbi:MAG: hypothetical protein HQK76_20825, partial [Desulfobacterales bacterium]|nr:hypothetical protein [Desulfobacterales bacterium]
HLFNNYLYAVIGNLELVLEDLENSQQHSGIKENIADSIKAAKLASEISGSMITYLGQKIAKLELFDISQWCKNNIFLLTTFTNKSIEINFNFTDKEIIVNANKSQLAQVLTQMITNAYESIVEGKGKITITTKKISKDDIELLYYGSNSNMQTNLESDAENNYDLNNQTESKADAQIDKTHLFPADFSLLSESYCCIDITDTGYGISKDDINKIFDPFFTTKFIGRGLGLAVVLGIIKSWEGIIGVRSRAGYGSSFMIFIPISLKKNVNKLYFS